ncbi:MAG: N-acetylmuramoyl-L-alanine amidase [Gammaproteobacteria bacterium]|jgi:N-acetylmuramoyl-L-alanine amidase|nr:N-acetylmuramoyl-L-alanine amidase [Gammaproteobacteria bacterium]
MRGSRIAAGLCALLIGSPVAAQPVNITEVRIAESAERTRIVLEIDGESGHKLFSLTNPNRVVVDLADARFALANAGIPAGAGPVANIRAANRESGTARLVLDLQDAVRPQSFILQPSGDLGRRLVIDLYAADAPARVVKQAPAAVQGQRDLIIAIDAGHGGKDPGAHGRSGLREKDVVLQIGRRLAKRIDAEPGMRSYLTRSRDEFLHLGERMERARRAGADLFISIHADAFTDRSVRGASVYALSEKGASDEAAALLARRENAADLLGGVDISATEDTVAKVLVDLSQNASLDASIEVGSLLIAELSRIGKVRKPTVQKAGFKVLKSADIPSLLVETAYISNPQDESNLKSVQYQERLAQAMHNSIRAYFYANPPQGTRVASLARDRALVREHVIRSGDTLSGIAQRYRVSIATLRSVNSLSSSRIRVGQVLRIPQA